MTRTKHRSHPTPAFPVACLAFADDSTLLLGGGGGPSRTGIKNKLKVCKASLDGRTLEDVTEHVFTPGEDLPTSMAINTERKQVVVGVNAAETEIKAAASPDQGNEHCRAFAYTDSKLVLVKSSQTISEAWSDDYPYQKFTTFSPTFDLLAIGTTDIDGTQSTVTILTYPDMNPIWSWKNSDSKASGELVDIDFSADGSSLAITTTTSIVVFRISGPSDSKRDVVQSASIALPQMGSDPLAFRSAKYNRQQAALPMIHAIINTNPKPAPRGKGKRPVSVKKGYCVNFGYVSGQKEKPSAVDGKWEIAAKRELGNVPVSAFEISADGVVLAYAAADYSIGLLDARTLAPLLKILHAHSFAITALAFNPSGNLLASAGADNTVRLIVIPSSFGSSTMTIVAVLMALLLVLVAYYLQKQ